MVFVDAEALLTVSRNRVSRREQSAGKGMENSYEVFGFIPVPPWTDPKFGRRRILETPSPENRENPAILAWKSGGLSPKSDFKTARFRPILMVEDAKFRTDFTDLDALLRP